MKLNSNVEQQKLKGHTLSCCHSHLYVTQHGDSANLASMKHCYSCESCDMVNIVFHVSHTCVRTERSTYDTLVLCVLTGEENILQFSCKRWRNMGKSSSGRFGF